MTSYIVRHGRIRFLGDYTVQPEFRLKREDKVIIASPRGTEVGTVLCESNPEMLKALVDPTQGQIQRLYAAHDRKKEEELTKQEENAFTVCDGFIAQRRLQMDLVDVEWLFGGERVVFYYLVRPPEKRIDFRELVKDLARSLHIRVEMRQIGIRDEAKLLADYGDCGKPVCCNTHLTVLPPVNMRMAKLQKSTLDPNKISGRCGRLKCCLRYEMEVYEDQQKDMPPIGAIILTKQGRGRVLAQEVLARKLLMQYEDGRRIIVPMNELVSVQDAPSHLPRKPHDSRDHHEHGHG